ncbi:hypothetical protein [Agrobacterium tumefaciens]|uniref:hypothetical protein n=1 Tax=Agrobacterium tumefaciens TaxID=358 RepID=UPI00287DE72A|nr:hypothetical protein [Agrobacterium tumefaciens]MDS7597204.1 hypothetical protein [Agrobacterium tumefaciens]
MTTPAAFKKKLAYQAVFIEYFAVFACVPPSRRHRNIPHRHHGRFVAAAQQTTGTKPCKTQKKRSLF